MQPLKTIAATLLARALRPRTARRSLPHIAVSGRERKAFGSAAARRLNLLANTRSSVLRLARDIGCAHPSRNHRRRPGRAVAVAYFAPERHRQHRAGAPKPRARARADPRRRA